MNKLKNKVFFTIFTIISLFLLSILILFNYQNYQREKGNIETSLTRLHNNKEFIFKSNQTPTKEINKIEPIEEYANKIFVDLDVYTIILSNNNQIEAIINHKEFSSSEDTEAEELEIKNIAKSILAQHNDEVIHIGNLYLEKNSYTLKPNLYLTIIGNKEVRTNLLNSLKASCLLFIILEIINFYLASLITKWIITPVINSFEKQKQFIADASHELKTPLAVIMASTDALETDKNKAKWLTNINNEADRMNKLISNLLDLTKLEQEEQPIREICNLSKVIEKQVLTFESLAYEKKIRLTYNIAENINFNCDSNQLKQLISILLDNAIKHSFKKEEILIELTKKKELIILKVTNKGDNIPLEEQAKIFERFYRVDKARSRSENRYGLSLAIAKNIVELHHGKISVSSIDGLTTFQVEFKNKF